MTVGINATSAKGHCIKIPKKKKRPQINIFKCVKSACDGFIQCQIETVYSNSHHVYIQLIFVVILLVNKKSKIDLKCLVFL